MNTHFMSIKEEKEETLEHALGDTPWCPLQCDGVVHYLVQARVWADGFALAATDLARVWACRAESAGAIAAQLTKHNPHLECTPARAAQLLAAALRRRPDPRTPLGGGSGGGAVFTAEETPLPVRGDSGTAAPCTVLTLHLSRRVAGDFCFRWAFVCPPLGLEEDDEVDVAQRAKTQQRQAEFLRAQLVAPALRTAAVALAALQEVTGPDAALDAPPCAEAFVARLSPAVLAAPPCTGALADALFRRCAQSTAPPAALPARTPSPDVEPEPAEPPTPERQHPQQQFSRKHGTKRPRHGFV